MTRHLKKFFFLLLCKFSFCSIFCEISPTAPSILLDFYCSIYVFIFQKNLLILWFLFDHSSCSVFTEVALLFKSLRLLMTVSLIFFLHTKLCLFHQNNYFMFVCLLWSCLSWIFEQQNLCSKSTVQRPGPFGVFHRELLFWLLLLRHVGQKLGQD